jgi:hypothetical protein
MARRILGISWSLVVLILMAALSANAQSFRVQCPTSTITHPNAAQNNSEPAYNGTTTFTTNAQGYMIPTVNGTGVPLNVNGAIKCQQVSGGDGYMTEADGTQTFMFSFGPLSGLADIAAGHPGTEFPQTFNVQYPGTLVRGDPATSDGATSGATPWTGSPSAFTPGFSFNGAIGLVPEVVNTVNVSDVVEGALRPELPGYGRENRRPKDGPGSAGSPGNCVLGRRHALLAAAAGPD